MPLIMVPIGEVACVVCLLNIVTAKDTVGVKSVGVDAVRRNNILTNLVLWNCKDM